MEQPSLEDMDPVLKSEDVNMAEAGKDLDSDKLTKPDDGSCAVEAEVEIDETGKAASEKDKANTYNMPEKPDEEFGASVMDDLPVCDDFVEVEASGVELFQNENDEEPEGQAEEDQRQITGARLVYIPFI